MQTQDKISTKCLHICGCVKCDTQNGEAPDEFKNYFYEPGFWNFMQHMLRRTLVLKNSYELWGHELRACYGSQLMARNPKLDEKSLER